MTGFDISLGGAAVAGLLSFLSPCVLPLVPPYLCYLGGISFDELQSRAAPAAAARRVWIAALAFVLGFSTVFIALGATATAIGQAVTEHIATLSKIAGVVIALLGLHFIGLFRAGFLDIEKRFHLERAPAGPLGAYVVGLAFAFGWSPCVGPVLASILLVAGGKDTAGQGALLLAAYSAGLGVPFFAAALTARWFLGWTQRFRRAMRAVEILIGIFLVAMGALVFAGSFGQAGYWLLDRVPGLSRFG